MQRHSRTWTRISVGFLLIIAFAFPAALAAGDSAGAPFNDFPSFISFDFSQNQIPEGVAVDKDGNVYVSIRFSALFWVAFPNQSDQIWKFTSSGEHSVFYDFGGDGGGAVGLAVDADGNVYMARSTPPIITAAGWVYQNGGVFRIDQAGNSELLPGTGQIGFPDGLAFDERGNLYVTEAHSFRNPDCPNIFDNPLKNVFGAGGIWVVPKDGSGAKPWLTDEPLLAGTCPGVVLRPFGANGIAYYHGYLYVINTDKGTVVRVPVLPDGTHGTPEVWARLQEIYENPENYYKPFLSLLQGAPPVGDGLAIDVNGNVYVTVPSRDAIVRISADGKSQKTIAATFPNLQNAPLVSFDFPTSLAFGTGDGARKSLFITNMGVANATYQPLSDFTWVGPGLVKLDVGTPGVPLP